jgi:hypothetical protein
MRALIAGIVAVGILYFWDTEFNNGKLTGGLVRLSNAVITGRR